MPPRLISRGRATIVASVLAAACLSSTSASAQTIRAPQQWGALTRGRYDVGFRLVGGYDRSRRTAPPADFEGKPNRPPLELPMQVALWYPAAASQPARSMQYGTFAALGAKRNDLRPITQGDRAMAIGNMRAFAGFAFNRQIPEDAMRALDTVATASVQDARPAPGRFPIVLAATDGSISAATVMFEYLASHGIAVITVASPLSYASLQVSRPGVVVEARVRDYEYLLDRVHAFSFLDTTRIALLGGNFDAMAALAFQMKNMAARAIVSLDGWEGKPNGAETVRASLHYEPRRLRVPYLTVQQNEVPPPPGLSLTRAVFDSLVYADRQWLVFDGMSHGYLVGNPLAYPGVPDEKRRAYELLVRGVQHFLAAALGDPSRPLTALVTAEDGGDGRSSLVKEAIRRDAHAPVPDDAELERLIMVDRDVDKVASILRRARQADSSFVLFPQGTMALYAFRFARQNDNAFALRLLALNADAFPLSWRAADALGDGQRAVGDTAGALASYRRAVSLLAETPVVRDTSAAAEGVRARQNIEAKIASLHR